MSYDPAQPSPIDVIRGMGRDTSNDPDDELMADAEYAAILGRFGVGSAPGTDVTTAAFHRAAAEAMRQLAVTASRELPSAVSKTATGSINWYDQVQPLRDQAKALDAAADRIDAASSDGFWGSTVTVRSRFLTGSVAEGAEW